MAYVDDEISNLINGVSQQPQSLRLASQAQTDTNSLGTLKEGLKKRPPFIHVDKLFDSANSLVVGHTINRDDNERYKVHVTTSQFAPAFADAFGSTAIHVNHVDGSERTVSIPDGVTYLDGIVDPHKDLSFTTVADYTFITNKKVTAAQTATVGATRDYEALVFVKVGLSSNTYNIVIDGTTRATYTGSSLTTTIADDLKADLDSWAGANFTFAIKGSVIHISNDTTDFDIRVEDDAGGQNMQVFKDATQNFTDLPEEGINGFTIQIQGDPTTEFDNYWVKYSSGGTNDFGTWVETVAPGLTNEIDPATMPHQLTRDTSAFVAAFAPAFGGQFTFQQATWESRGVGDATSNAPPSFIGEKINDVTFSRSRLGLLAGENGIFSEQGEFFNFWRTSITDVLDTDRIDIASTSDQVAILHHAKSYKGNLIAFSSKAQFNIKPTSNALGFTPDTVEAPEVTSFEMNVDVPPEKIGKSIFFAETKDQYAAVREFKTDRNTQEDNADNITKHVSEYIAGNLVQFAGTSNDDLLVCFADGNLNKLYIYKFIVGEDGARILSSWRDWSIESTDRIVDIGIIDTFLYVTIVRQEGTFLEKVNLDPGTLVGHASTDLTFTPLLDRYFTATGVYDGTNTTWTIPYEIPTSEVLTVVRGSSFVAKEGSKVASVSRPTTTTIQVTGDQSSGICHIGKLYTQTYQFTELAIRTQSKETRGTVTLKAGKLYIKKMAIKYFQAGYFKVLVTPKGRDTITYTFSGRIIGDASNIIGDIAFADGEFSFRPLGKSSDLTIQIVNDSFIPSSFISAYWQGNYVSKSSKT